MAFTGNKDVDRMILLTLDDYDLASICKTNKYFKFLCSEELLWKIKTLEKFKYELGGITGIQKYIEEYDFKTWRLYYISLIDFLEKKWIDGCFEYFLRREDISRLNTYMDRASDRFLQDLDNFLENWTLNEKSLKAFMDGQLDDDLLNPNIIFEHINSYKYDNIGKYSSYIIEYMLQSKDRRIHIEYSHNTLLRKMARSEKWNYEKRMLFTKLLEDPRVDLNYLLYDNNNPNNIAVGSFADVIFQNVRLRPDSIMNVIKDFVRKEMDPTDLIRFSKAFLNRGGSISDLLEIIKEVKYYDKPGWVILKDSIETTLL